MSPQDSKLGPLLFLIYVNDITDLPGSQTLAMYADDTNVFFTADNTTELQQCVNEYATLLSDWWMSNKLQLNATKTTYIIFRAPNKRIEGRIEVKFNNFLIKQVKQQKFLGIHFSEELSWNTHVNSLCGELSKNIGVIYRIAHLIPLWLKKQLYNALIYSKLCYGILVWGTTTRTNYTKLITLQKRVICLYANYHGCFSDLRTGPLFQKYDMLLADRIYYMQILLEIRKRNPGAQCSERNLSGYFLRHSTRRTPKARTNYGKQTFVYQSTKIMNRFGASVSLNISLKTFKKEIRDWLDREDIYFKIE